MDRYSYDLFEYKSLRQAGRGLVLLLQYSTVWDLASYASLLGTESTGRPSIKCGEGFNEA